MNAVLVIADSTAALDKYITPGETGLVLLIGAAPFLILGAVLIVWLLGRKDGRPLAQVLVAVALFVIIACGGTGGLFFAFGEALSLPFPEEPSSLRIVLSLLTVPAALASLAAVTIVVRAMRALAGNRTAA